MEGNPSLPLGDWTKYAFLVIVSGIFAAAILSDVYSGYRR